ncbi:hypothetical protein BSZ19_03415 [Bradyrhizobium japonicum]|uniref:Transposase InsH N-terminal domain-containing protein n=1 Tax=Bradyrhizobium japonicum TaxID=375 RepID=A0A1Y2JY47_BRAJP|nr:hypothetical protein BSZ19_03415 [Bradyrhizobium japonicum]
MAGRLSGSRCTVDARWAVTGHPRRSEAQVNVAIRWFVGYGPHDALPDHSSLIRIRERWGAERHRMIFKRTVGARLKAKIATAEVVHIDASLIRTTLSSISIVGRAGGTVTIGLRHVSSASCIDMLANDRSHRQGQV